VAANGRAAVVVPVRKLPLGPAFEVHFQAAATVLAVDDPRTVDLLRRGVLAPVTGHGELDEPDICFLELRPTGRIHSYGLGAPLLSVARDPLHVGSGMIDLHGDEFTDPRQRPSR
jgi:hypothetical protein